MNRPPQPRLVLDTNVFVSAVLFSGKPGRILSMIQSGEGRLLLSAPVLKEYIRVLAYPKFDLSPADIRRLIQDELIPWSEPIRVSTKVRAVREDPSDDKFLELAIEGKADYIVSGDGHLLTLKSYRGISILSVEGALSELKV